MLATIVCAVLGGARGFSAIAQGIHAQPREVWWLPGYYRTPPKENALRKLMARLDPEVLEAALRGWIVGQVEVDDGEFSALAIDGKTLCSTLAEHGRVVTRSLTASTRIVPFLTRWPGLEQVVRLERTTKRDGKLTTEVQYAITSLSRPQAEAAKLLGVRRSHGGIENRLHGVRDTLWQEDRCRIKNPTAGHNLACFRNAAINLLRLAKTPNLNAAIRHNAYRIDLLLPKLGFVN